MLGKGLRKQSSASLFIHALWRNSSARLGIGLILVLIIISVMNVFYPEYLAVRNAFNINSFSNIARNISAQPLPPTFDHGWRYVMGTTSYGVPILPVSLAAVTVDLAFSIPIAVISAIIGTGVGVITTYFSRKAEFAMVSIATTATSFPLLISAIIFGLMLGFNYIGISLGIIFVLWSYYAIIARNLVLDLKNRQFIEASRAAGASKFRIIFRHIIPNSMTPIMVRFSLDLATVIAILSAINFLFYFSATSLAPYPELGALIAGLPSVGYLYASGNPFSPFVPINTLTLITQGDWWTVLFPSFFLMVLIATFVTLSTGLRETLDPRSVV